MLRMSYQERLAIYRESIERGSTELRFGTPVTRFLGIRAAALDGMLELLPLIREHYPSLPPEHKSRLSYLDILLMLELGAGGCDRESAARLTAQRFALADARRFRFSMEQDASFRSVFLRTAAFVCEPHPLGGEVNRGCGDAGGVLAAQREIQQATLADAARSGDDPATPVLPDPSHWLELLDNIVDSGLSGAR